MDKGVEVQLCTIQKLIQNGTKCFKMIQNDSYIHVYLTKTRIGWDRKGKVSKVEKRELEGVEVQLLAKNIKGILL